MPTVLVICRAKSTDIDAKCRSSANAPRPLYGYTSVLHEGLRQAARAHWSRRPPSRLGAVPFQAGPFSQHYIIQIFMQQHGKLDNVYVCFEPLALCENVQLRRDPDPEPRHRA
ncbi:hypothetical protein KL921_003726 [Ogataea angusta]|nr:hypothetical protein KL921_003726 [Ogataea angusta]